MDNISTDSSALNIAPTEGMTSPPKTRTIPNIMQHHVIFRPGGLIQPTQNSKFLHQVPNLPTGVTKVLLLNNKPRQTRPIAMRPMPPHQQETNPAPQQTTTSENNISSPPRGETPGNVQQKLSAGMKTMQMKAMRLDKASMKLIPVGPEEEIRMAGMGPAKITVGPGKAGTTAPGKVGPGPGRGNNQGPKEKRLVRKFCLVPKPDGNKDGSKSEPPVLAGTKKVLIARPHKTPPESIPCPKFISQGYNREFMRYERIIQVSAREIRITESQTQTDPDLTLQSSTADLENMGINEESSTLKRALLLGPENSVLETKKRRLRENFKVLDKLIENPFVKSKLAILRERPQLLEKARKDYEICQQQDEYGNLPLHIAVINNRTSAIVRQAMVLKAFGKSIDQRNRRGLTPLQLCLFNNCEPEAVRKLVRLEANLKLRDPQENTVLHLAVLHSSAESLAELLPFVDDLVNEFNEDGLAPLHLAVMANKMEHVSLLIKSANVDVNLPDVRSGRTPLFHASERKYLDLARLILCSGGSKQVVNYAGQSVLTMSLESELLKGMESDEDSPPIKRRGKARK